MYGVGLVVRVFAQRAVDFSDREVGLPGLRRGVSG
jgi:hypothetical protein